MLVIQLQYVAEETRKVLEKISDPDTHSLVMDAYFRMCERAGIGNKSAVQALTPSITDEDYYEINKEGN